MKEMILEIVKIFAWPGLPSIFLIIFGYKFLKAKGIDNVNVDVKNMKFSLSDNDGDIEENLRFLEKFRYYVEKICSIKYRKKEKEYFRILKHSTEKIKLQSTYIFQSMAMLYKRDGKYKDDKEMLNDKKVFKEMMHKQKKEIYSYITSYIIKNGFHKKDHVDLQKEKESIISSIIERNKYTYLNFFQDRFKVDFNFIKDGNWLDELVKLTETNLNDAIDQIHNISKQMHQDILHYEKLIDSMINKGEKKDDVSK